MPTDSPSRRDLAPGLTIEDAGDGFFLILEGPGHDTTISLDDEIADDVAAFISERRAMRQRLN